ncbi:site-specific DNA-methyltransferase, partial [Flectobacillus sp. DC10W]
MDGASLNITQDLIQKLKEIIPQVFTEDKIDITRLQTILGDSFTADAERYGLSWAGKSEAYKVLQTPTTATLIPNPDQSIDWDNAENVFIEGENLEVLKVLQKSYYGKVKMIYIDPPYNTGNDSFIYPDKFSETKEEYLKRIGDKDDDGFMMKEGLFRKNNKENGQFHSNWLNMMLPRLFLARNLLKDDGVIFVSIDDNEQANLKLLMDEIFGEENFVACFIWQKIHSTKNDAKYVSDNHEYVLLYAKAKEICTVNLLPRTQKMNERYQNPDNDPRGAWASGDLVANEERSSGYFEIKSPTTGKTFNVPLGKHWVYSESNLNDMIKDNRIWFGKDGNAFPRLKRYLTEVQQGKKVDTILMSEIAGNNQEAKREANRILQANIFDTPKPVKLIKLIQQLAVNKKEDIILDFFAGSGTTAQAVMELNEEDGGKRKYICVQLPEKIEETNEGYKAGYKTISDISKARIEKVIEKIKKERDGKIELEKYQNLGFRKYALASSNFKIWRGDVVENEEDLIKQMELFTTPQKEGKESEN